MICAKFGWHWPSDCGEEDFKFINVFSLFLNYLPLKKGGALRIPEKKSKIGKVYRQTDGHQWNNKISLRQLLYGIAIYKTNIFISRLDGSSLDHCDINNTCTCINYVYALRFRDINSKMASLLRIEPLSINNNDPLLFDITNIDSINNYKIYCYLYN